MFSASSETALWISNCEITEIGNHIMYHLEDLPVKSFLKEFEEVMISVQDKDRALRNNTDVPNGLVKALGGNLAMDNCTITYTMS